MNKNYFTSAIPIRTLKIFSFLLVISFSTYGQTGIFKTSGSLEIPAGVGVPGHLIKVQAWGAGGGGGGADKLLGIVNLLAAGGGGGGGAFNTDDINVGTNPSNVIVNYTVGTGGAGEISSSDHNGESGKPTSFPTSVVSTPFISVVANGGAGGNKGGLNLTTLVGTGGLGGVGKYSGGKGNSASLLDLGLTLVSGGGGGGAGSNGNGSNSINGVLSRAGGAGGNGNTVDEKGGSGADGLVGKINILGSITLGGSGNGENGFAPGGGGGGGAIVLELLGSGTKGGKGGDGQIKVTYTCPTYIVESVSANNVCAASGTTTVTLNSTAAGLPIGKYTVTYQVSSPSQTGLKAIDVNVATAGTLSFLVTGLTTVGTSRITINNLTSGKAKVDCPDCFCSTNIFGKYVDVIVSTIPAAGTITGTPTVCQGQSGVGYSVAGISNATSYNWSYSGTGVTFTNATTNTPTVSFAVNATSGNLTVRGVNSCGDGIVSANYPITTNPSTVISSQSTATQTRCLNAAFTPITVTAAGIGLSYQWFSNTIASATGGTSLGTANGAQTNSYTPQSTTTGTLYYYSVVTGTCGNATSAVSGAFITNLVPTAPTVGTITNVNCLVNTGSVELGNLPSSGTWTINPGNYTGSGSITTISGLAVGNYTFTVSNGSCTSAASANVAIVDPVVTNTWTGTWSNGTPPTIDQRIIFDADFTSIADVEGCSCQVNAAKKVVFKSVGANSGHTLKVTNQVVVLGSGVNKGMLTFENNASLIQVEDAAINSGDIHYKRHTNYVKRYDFTYWSSPVKGQTMKALSPNTLFDKYYRYDPDAGWKISYSGVDVMNKGEGYIIRAPQNFSTTSAAIDTNPTFVGEPHNGEITKTIVGGKVYLLGNPYPSAIDADEFLSLNSAALGGTLYFWTHNSPPRTGVPGGDATYSYTTNDYATFNGTGGVGTAGAISGGAPPSGKIAAGQGFFAPASAAGGTVIYNNGMRISGGASGTDNSQFFRLSGNSKTAKLAVTKEKNRLWLNLTNAEGAFKQTLIGYITGATNDYDSSFDGITYDGNQFIDFYSINNEVNLSIQGRALPFEKKDSIALGYKSTIKGDFKISIDHTDGSLSSQNIFVEDKDLKVLHDLKKGPYAFITEKGVFNNRFVLRYLDKNEVEVIVPETPAEVVVKGVIVSVQDRKITVTADATLDKVIVYDMTGRKIFQKNNVNENIFVVPYLLSSHQVLAVDIVLLDGTKVSRKVVY